MSARLVILLLVAAIAAGGAGLAANSWLATQRAAAVKDYLVTKHAVSASRLVACQANIDDADDAGEPRVELLI